MPHRITLAVLMSPLLFALPLGPVAAAQTPAAPMAPNTATQARSQANIVLGDSLQQMTVTMDRLHRGLASINIAKWKAPGDVRQTTQSDVDSMLRDLNDTLPSLVNTAQGDPAKVASVFAVYRNVDALYDVLLRVSETAQLASATTDARLLEDQRSSLESTRSQLGTALLQSAQVQDSEVNQLRRAAQAPVAVPAPTRTVVDDGPPAHSKTTTRRPRKPPTTTQQAPQ